MFSLQIQRLSNELPAQSLRLRSPNPTAFLESYFFCIRFCVEYLISSSCLNQYFLQHFYLFILFETTETPNVLLFIICTNLSFVPQNTVLDQLSLLIVNYSKKWFHELHLGLHYLSNDTEIIVFGSRLTEKFGVTIKHIEVKEHQSNIANRGNVALIDTSMLILSSFDNPY